MANSEISKSQAITRDFVYNSSPGRVIFGTGTVVKLRFLPLKPVASSSASSG
jgi:hypothetical protein